MSVSTFSSWVLLGCGFVATAIAADVPNTRAAIKDEHVAVELLAEHSSAQPGTRTWVGLKLIHQPHWHTYWTNSGDSGLPTKLAWQLPAGFKAGEIAWLAPTRFELGGLFNFGYEGTVLLPVPIDIPANAKPGMVQLSVDVRWVVCNDDTCIPGKGVLQLGLPVKETPAVANASTAPAFALARSQWPKTAAWTGTARNQGDSVRIELLGPELPTAQALDAFPTAPKLLANTPIKFSREGDKLILVTTRSEYFEAAPSSLSLVLTQRGASQPPRSWQIAVPWIAGNTSSPAAVK